jgi:hypothetical protein
MTMPRSEPQPCGGGNRQSTFDVLKDKAKRSRRRAEGLELLASLIEQGIDNMKTERVSISDDEEAMLWQLIWEIK